MKTLALIALISVTAVFAQSKKDTKKPAAAPAPQTQPADVVIPEGAVEGADPSSPAKPSGVVVGNAIKACTPGDTSPAGTVANGYKKVVEATPFGDACHWLQVQ